MKRRKVWIGLGTAVLINPQAQALSEAAPPIARDVPAATAASGSDEFVIAQHRGAGHETATTKPRAEGEGGGEGEGGAADANLAPNLRFYRDIQLIRGHLLVGDELAKEGRWNDALAHFLHPSEEIYGAIGADLKSYDVAPFQTALKALAQTTKAKSKEAYATALTAVEERLAAADRSLRAKEQDWPSFIMETVLEVLQSAAHEYEEAVEGGRIKNVVEYQDARLRVAGREAVRASPRSLPGKTPRRRRRSAPPSRI